MKRLSFIGVLILLVAIAFALPTSYLNIVETSLTFTRDPGTTTTGTFTINNTGQSDITNIGFSEDGEITGFISIFNPSLVTSLPPNQPTLISFDITIPAGTTAGNYEGNITAQSADDSSQTDTVPVTITVNSLKALNVVEPSVSLEGVQGNQTNTGTFTINNIGNVILSNVQVENLDPDNFKDANNNQIILNFGTIPSINPGELIPISVSATIPSDQFLGTYSGTIKVSDGVASDTFTLNVKVESEFVSIDITDIDPDDKVAPGEELSIDVRVDNIYTIDLENIKVEVKIENIDDGDDLKEESSEFDLDVGDDNEETLTFTIPLNVDENKYNVIIVVDGEDDDGNNFEVSQVFTNEIEVEKDENDEISVDSLTLNPETVSCGQLLEIEVKVVNTGQDDQKDMYLKVSARGLFDVSSNSFDLEGDDGNFDDREITKVFTVTIPEDADETTYLVDVQAYDEDDATIDTNQLDTIKMLTVSGNCEAAVTVKDAEIILDSTSIDVDVGDTITIDLIIKNNGDSTNEYEVEIEDYESFATLIGIDQPIQDIDEGETGEAVISLSIDDDASAGSYAVTINVNENGEILDSKTVNVRISEGAEEKIVPSVPTVTGFTSAIDKLFGAENTAGTIFFILANLVLIAVIIFFIKLIVKK